MSEPGRKPPRAVSAAELRRVLRRQMPGLAERYKVKSLGVFGSFIRQEQSKRSDVDLLVEFSEAPDLFDFMDLEQHLEKILNVKVDLVTRGALKGNIGKRILDEVVPL